ncbi:TetR/AcrR family transcriptional regulator [Amycolatopsis sp. cmx-4-68]|uniref:TetR/AcrR family transcriptional regulator n=1 Tax=Amycolatopsis sp. cmx-4-68 TaxID=2790938 RepID=UPI00397A5B98
MANVARGTQRRTDALTRERIVTVAIELLDSVGEGGLTFRALASMLGTGHGAIQWHIANKGELLTAATEAVISRALAGTDPHQAPRDAIRALALGVFGAIEQHPWVGGQLTRPPWHATMLDIFELVGRQVRALGVPIEARFTATSALLVHIIGAGSQQATNSLSPEAENDRQEFLDQLSARWADLDPQKYEFTRSIVEQLRVHDDRVEFLAGIDLILAGLPQTRC